MTEETEETSKELINVNLNVPENLRAHTFDKKPESINKKGRPPSIRKQVRQFLAADGSINIPLKDVITFVHDVYDSEGKLIAPGYVKIKLPKSEALVTKLFSLAMSGRNATAVRAFEVIQKLSDDGSDDKKYKRKIKKILKQKSDEKIEE